VAQEEAIMQVTTSWEEKGIEAGIGRGIEQERRSLVLRLLNRKVGSLPDRIQSQVEALSLDQLGVLSEALLDFTSLNDLENWLVDLED
jgi:hypothetical protein